MPEIIKFTVTLSSSNIPKNVLPTIKLCPAGHVAHPRHNMPPGHAGILPRLQSKLPWPPSLEDTSQPAPAHPSLAPIYLPVLCIMQNTACTASWVATLQGGCTGLQYSSTFIIGPQTGSPTGKYLDVMISQSFCSSFTKVCLTALAHRAAQHNSCRLLLNRQYTHNQAAMLAIAVQNRNLVIQDAAVKGCLCLSLQLPSPDPVTCVTTLPSGQAYCSSSEDLADPIDPPTRAGPTRPCQGRDIARGSQLHMPCTSRAVPLSALSLPPCLPRIASRATFLSQSLTPETCKAENKFCALRAPAVT